MGRTLAQRDTPRFTQIHRPYTLTDDERERLAVLKDVYPFIEYTTTRREMNRLVLERWCWRNGDES